jgi:hypothetical protein
MYLLRSVRLTRPSTLLLGCYAEESPLSFSTVESGLIWQMVLEHEVSVRYSARMAGKDNGRNHRQLLSSSWIASECPSDG